MTSPVKQADGFWRSPPGQRFQNRYWRHQRRGNDRSLLFRVVLVAVAMVVGVLGVALLVLPGPGVLLLGLAGALVASESLTIARLLDWIEVDARAFAGWVRRRFRRKARDA